MPAASLDAFPADKLLGEKGHWKQQVGCGSALPGMPHACLMHAAAGLHALLLNMLLVEQEHWQKQVHFCAYQP